MQNNLTEMVTDWSSTKIAKMDLIREKKMAVVEGLGRIQDFLKGGYIYRGVGGSLCWFYLIFLKYPMKIR